MLVGKTDVLESAIRESGVSREGLSIRDAQDVITMTDDPVHAIREKKAASMVVALNAAAAGEGDAVVSAGNTGALLTGATLIVRRLHGARRGALGSVMPTGQGHALLMDCGANVECTPEMLVQFAYMGSAFMAGTMGIASPRVGLVNNGSEPEKGPPMYVETHRLLRAADERGLIRFIGNVEGRDLLVGAADVYVADGFTGNLILKTLEGAGLYFAGEIKRMLLRNAATKLTALTLRGGLSDLKKRMDYKEVGGAPILGIRRPVIKAHGASNARAFESAILQAVRFCESGAIANMERALSSMKTNDEGGASK